MFLAPKNNDNDNKLTTMDAPAAAPDNNNNTDTPTKTTTRGSQWDVLNATPPPNSNNASGSLNNAEDNHHPVPCKADDSDDVPNFQNNNLNLNEESSLQKERGGDDNGNEELADAFDVATFGSDSAAAKSAKEKETTRQRTQRLFREGERRSGRVARVQLEKEQKEALAVALAAENAERGEARVTRDGPNKGKKDKTSTLKAEDAVQALAVAWDDSTDNGPFAPSATAAFQRSPAAGLRRRAIVVGTRGGTRDDTGDAIDEEAEEAKARRLRQAWLEGGSKFSQGIKYLNATDDTHAETRRLYARTRDECASVQEDAGKDGEQARKRLRGAEVHPLVRLTSKDVEIDDAAAYTRMLARSILNL